MSTILSRLSILFIIYTSRDLDNTKILLCKLFIRFLVVKPVVSVEVFFKGFGDKKYKLFSSQWISTRWRSRICKPWYAPLSWNFSSTSNSDGCFHPMFNFSRRYVIWGTLWFTRKKNDLSYDNRSAKFDAKFFNFFARLIILFYFRSEKFRTSVNGKIKKQASEKVDKFCIKFHKSVNVALLSKTRKFLSNILNPYDGLIYFFNLNSISDLYCIFKHKTWTENALMIILWLWSL